MLNRAVALILFAALTTTGCERVAGERTGSISINPKVLRLGTVKHGQVASGQFVIRNETATEVRLDRFESSCPCVRLTGAMPPVRLAPGESSIWAVLFDPQVEPEYNGRLAVKLDWADESGLSHVQASVAVIVE